MTHQQRFIGAVSRILWDTDLIGSRLTLALAEFVWGILLLWPGRVFHIPMYSNLFGVMSADAWGTLFLLTSIGQMSILMSDKLHTWFARMFASWNMVLWVSVIVGLTFSVYPPPATIGGEIALMLSAVWIWIRPYILAEGHKRVASTRFSSTSPAPFR